MAAPEENVETLRAFMAAALYGRRGEEAVAKYVGDDYIQHNPNVRTGKEGFIELVDNMPPEIGEATFETKLTVANEEYVVLLQHVTGKDDPTPGRAVVDIIRFDENGKIVEHWDIIQEVPAPSEFKHDNGFF